ncbi:uncharacterized protein LOC110443940, partial [Mizuhopecten yessoensis]
MKKNGIAVTVNSNKSVMPCEQIIHLNAEERKTDWRDKFLLAMKMANDRNARSVAFPAMGTAMDFKPEAIASSFVDALVEFVDLDPDCVKEIHLVIFEQPMVQKFITTMQTSFQQHKQKKPNNWMMQKVSNIFSLISGKHSTDQRFEWEPRINVIHQDKSRFPIMVYGPDQRRISDAISALETLLEKNFREKIFSEDIIKNFSKSQVNPMLVLQNLLHGVNYT